MSGITERALVQLRSTRDLRAEILSLAADIADGSDSGCLIMIEPVLNPGTVQAEWDRLLPVLSESVRGRMSLIFQPTPADAAPSKNGQAHLLRLPRPNYRYEVIRLLITANLRQERPPSIRELMDSIGASQTPIRQALADLKQSGLVRAGHGGLDIVMDDLSQETLSRVRALPQVLRFRFELGAPIKSPVELLRRAAPLLSQDGPGAWRSLKLSGVPAAQHAVPNIDILGTPRLDLVAQVGRTQATFDTILLRQLDVGLEPQPSVLAPSPVAVTLVRADIDTVRTVPGSTLRHASEGDVALSLLDLGLREQLLQYTRAMRK